MREGKRQEQREEREQIKNNIVFCLLKDEEFCQLEVELTHLRIQFGCIHE